MNPWAEARGSDSAPLAPIYLKKLTSRTRGVIFLLTYKKGLTFFHAERVNLRICMVQNSAVIPWAANHQDIIASGGVARLADRAPYAARQELDQRSRFLLLRNLIYAAAGERVTTYRILPIQHARVPVLNASFSHERRPNRGVRRSSGALCVSTNTGPLQAPPSTFRASERCPGLPFHVVASPAAQHRPGRPDDLPRACLG
jgi:hypothetical protein